MSDNRGQLLTPGSGRGARLAGPRWPESAGKAVSRNARHLDFVVPVAQPFTFPSLSSFEEAFEEALVASAAAEGLSPPTVAGIRYSLRRLTDFIRGRRLERALSYRDSSRSRRVPSKCGSDGFALAAPITRPLTTTGECSTPG
ncbi:MAG: hypothetical protein IPP07_30190 [Holophagales bacterium]|nr:hypothetical protein [Holophagales bacterium]